MKRQRVFSILTSRFQIGANDKKGDKALLMAIFMAGISIFWNCRQFLDKICQASYIKKAPCTKGTESSKYNLNLYHLTSNFSV